MSAAAHLTLVVCINITNYKPGRPIQKKFRACWPGAWRAASSPPGNMTKSTPAKSPSWILAPSCSSRKNFKTNLELPVHMCNMTITLSESMSLLWHDQKLTLTLQNQNTGHVVDFKREREGEGISTKSLIAWFLIIMLIKVQFFI